MTKTSKHDLFICSDDWLCTKAFVPYYLPAASIIRRMPLWYVNGLLSQANNVFVTLGLAYMVRHYDEMIQQIKFCLYYLMSDKKTGQLVIPVVIGSSWKAFMCFNCCHCFFLKVVKGIFLNSSFSLYHKDWYCIN